jgi:hypothetical protein
VSSQPPLEVLIAVRPRLFASALGRLLDRDGRRVTIVDPEVGAIYGDRYDVAVISEGPTLAAPGVAVIRLADPEQGRPSSTVRIGSQHEIVAVTSTMDLVALVDRAGLEARGRAEA